MKLSKLLGYRKKEDPETWIDVRTRSNPSYWPAHEINLAGVRLQYWVKRENWSRVREEMDIIYKELEKLESLHESTAS